MHKAKILIIDDEPDMLSGCSKLLSALGYQPVPILDCALAINSLGEEDYDVILCDLLMPNNDGIKVLEICHRLAPDTPVIIFSAYGTIDRAVLAMKAGAFDFLEKPFDPDRLHFVIEKGVRQRQLFLERNSLLQQLEDKYNFDNIIGKSKEMQNIFEMIENVAKTDINVLITGESGTGKELIARSIHARSKRNTSPFVPVNCGAFPENLFEAEIFGYEKGAFTGAIGKKIGLIEYANKGTFFLDEVCEMPTGLQIKMLRTLQDQQLRRVGGNELIKVNIRIISATNKNVKQSIADETLRMDFFYRINVINIEVPPLRQRAEDIKLLANHFLQIGLKKTSKNISDFSDEVLFAFDSYNWPGNVRELENVVERAIALAKDQYITISDLPPSIIENLSGKGNFKQNSLVELKKKAAIDVEKKYLLFLLNKFKGNITKVAEEAGITRRHIHRIMKLFKINPNIYRNKNAE